MKFEKALFMSNFGVDMGMPEFRVGSFATYLLPLSQMYGKAFDSDIKFLMGSHTLDLLNRKQNIKEINRNNSFIIEGADYAPIFGYGDEFILQSYDDDFGDKLEIYKNYFTELFSGWEPDVIFCWEFPTTLFRKLFPKALILDIMPGAYMRPPYPKTISIDPVGLYKNSFLQSYSSDVNYSDLDDLSDFYKIRDMYANYFNNDIDVKNVILDLVDPDRKFQEYWLVPLQVSSYFGFYANSKYRDQFEFLTDVMAKAPKNVGVIFTQYIGNLVSDKVISNRNLGYIRNLHSNFLYSTEFEKLDNLSQYIIPWVDTVVTVSSTLGFQALLHGKNLISPSTSHLSYVSSTLEEDKAVSEDFVASLICRQNPLVEKLLSDVGYFKSVITSLASRKSDSAIDVLKALPKISNLYQEYLALSPFSAADNQIKRMGGVVSGKKNSLRGLLDRIDNFEIVSFDIFDTLLKRSVFKPEDAFILIQKKLEAEHRHLLNPLIVKRFPELRAGFERQLRKELDEKNAILDPSEEKTEEFFIQDVYRKMLNAFGAEESLSDALTEVEQEVEFSILAARSLGKIIFDYALAKGKRVILVSDFIHDERFVAQALANANYIGYEHLYVSSELGLKKHSGSLFKYVLKDLNVTPEQIIHIGDNSTGDFLKAIESGIYPTKIFSTRERVNQIFKNRNLELPVLDNSFYLRSAINLYAEDYYDALLVNGDKPVTSTKEKREVFSTPGEFGFLVMGPVLYEFTKWILDKAIEQQCSKVLFFARDCSLPYQMAVKLVANIEKYAGLEPIYLAVSRKALTCLNVNEPNDCFKVRIDDFSRNKTLSSLLKSRFKIDSESVDEKYYKKWNIQTLDCYVKECTLGAIYGLVHEYLSENWNEWNAAIQSNKIAFKHYLKSKQLDCLDDVVAVDFGYKGSAHSVVSEFFDNKFVPLFFMTYAGEMGNAPYPHAEAFANNNLNVQHKRSTPLISHNLIIETIINEPIGSLTDYTLVNDTFELSREELESDGHLTKIRSIHSGAMKFCDRWISSFENLGYSIRLEDNSSTYLMHRFFSAPVQADLDILKGLIFDNSYAGIQNIYILSPNKPNDADVWREGLALSKKLTPQKNVVSAAAQSVKAITSALVNSQPTIKKSSHQKHSPSIDLDDFKTINLKHIKSYHRTEFLTILSAFAFPGKACAIDPTLIDMVVTKGKNHVALKFLKANGGLWRSKLLLKDKIYLATASLSNR